MDPAPFLALLAANAQADGPTWAPIVFAAVAFAFMVVVLFAMRQKIRQNEQWSKMNEDPDERPDSDEHGKHDRED